MSLIAIWSFFILLISYCEDFNIYQYLVSSCFMLRLTYSYNQVHHINIPLKLGLLLFNIPSLIFWYIAFVYNDFLAINPISCELFLLLFFIYAYLILYVTLSPELKSY